MDRLNLDGVGPNSARICPTFFHSILPRTNHCFPSRFLNPSFLLFRLPNPQIYPYEGFLACNHPLYGYNQLMARASQSVRALPSVAVDQLQRLGRDLAIARKRRHMSLREMADRMMVNIKTVQRLEKGDPAVGIGILAAALWILGMHRRLGDLVSPETDATGLQEEIRNLPRDFRKTKDRTDKYDF